MEKQTNTSNGSSSDVLRVTVVNDNLRFVRHPLLLGHYRSTTLTGTEHVMDELIGGDMSTGLRLGEYPEQPGSHEVFINTQAADDNPLRLPRPQAVIVVGLGDEGLLKPMELARTVCAGVIAWARRLAEDREQATKTFELAATLAGSGGTGIDAAQSASLVVEGVLAANERLRSSNWPRVGTLHLIELYLDRASEAWRALHMQARSEQEKFRVDRVITSGDGALRTPVDGGYRGARYDLITAVTDEARGGISYTVDTRRARTEVQAHAMQRPLLRDLLVKPSSIEKLGRTLFRLLVPVELEPFLASTTEAVIELDTGTAGIPWEMLDTTPDGRATRVPWAISAKLLRKLRTHAHRPRVVDATRHHGVLVIGEPACDARYGRLPGARGEAGDVAGCLRDARRGVTVTELVRSGPSDPGPLAHTIISTLVSGDWRILHVSGHGERPAAGADGSPGEPRGVVLSDGIYLGAREISSMRVVPELVFVNCCHLAARDSGDLLQEDDYDRPQFAATVAEALIRVGVRCVIAAGWAVEDRAARDFATTFYRELVKGRRFIEAVAAARAAAHTHRGSTWAAYQCYGDPDWTFLPPSDGGGQEPAPPETAFATVASPMALELALEGMAINSAFDPVERDALSDNLAYLEEQFRDRWGGQGAVAEAFGRAWAQTDRGKAIAWYQRALEANDGGAPVRAAEQLGNLRVRAAWESVSPWSSSPDRPPTPERLDAARSEIRSALALLERLADGVQSTSERESLCGSAWKRLAMVEAIAGDHEAEEKAIARMKERYARAEELARDRNGVPVFYPALNCMGAELITDAGPAEWPGFAPARVADVQASLHAQADSDPDFWSVSGLIELRLYEAVAQGNLAGVLPALQKEYADLHQRDASKPRWESADDQMHFVLTRYRARASEAERAAVDALLAALHGYAGRNGATPHSGNGTG